MTADVSRYSIRLFYSESVSCCEYIVHEEFYKDLDLANIQFELKKANTRTFFAFDTYSLQLIDNVEHKVLNVFSNIDFCREEDLPF